MEKKEITRRRNSLLRALDILDVYKQNKVDGMPDTFVFRKFIEQKFRISYQTFSSYLGRNIQRELDELNKITKN